MGNEGNGRTPDPLCLAEPILATDSFQNNVVININEVFSFRVTYLDIWAVAAQAHILDGVRTLYSWSEEQLIHSFGRHAEEVLNGSRALCLNWRCGPM